MMSNNYETKLKKILTGTAGGYQLQLNLFEYCGLQVSEFDFDLFGILFFEKNPLIIPFFISNTKEPTFTLLDVDRIPWKDNPGYWKETVRLPVLRRWNPVKKEIRRLTGMKMKSCIIAPLLIKEKMVGSIIIGYKKKKKDLKEGIVYLACLSSIQVTEAIEKTVSHEAWYRSRLISSACYDYGVNRLSMKHEGNPYIVVDILKRVFDLRCVLIIRLKKNSGYLYYFAKINEKGDIINRETGQFEDKKDISILIGKKMAETFLEVPIEEDNKQVGSIYLTYTDQDNVFKDETREIVQRSALKLSNFVEPK